MSYREKVGATPAQQGTDPEEALLPCRWCGQLAKWKHLSMYGARCVPCYRDWLGRPSNTPTLTADQKARLLRSLGRQGDIYNGGGA